jgi:hypothetical protein
MKDLFEKASRMKLRFVTPVGNLVVEDLWDLPLTSGVGHANLDDLAKAFNDQLQNSEVSFVKKPAEKDKAAAVSFEIVKHVIKVRLAENQAAKDALDRKAKKEKIMEIISRKQDAELESTSLEELQAQLDAL